MSPDLSSLQVSSRHLSLCHQQLYGHRDKFYQILSNDLITYMFSILCFWLINRSFNVLFSYTFNNIKLCAIIILTFKVHSSQILVLTILSVISLLNRRKRNPFQERNITNKIHDIHIPYFLQWRKEQINSKLKSFELHCQLFMNSIILWSTQFAECIHKCGMSLSSDIIVVIECRSEL